MRDLINVTKDMIKLARDAKEEGFRAGQEDILRRLEELNEDTECAMIDAYLASGHKYSISNGIIAAMAALIVNLRSQIEKEAKNG